MMACRLQKKNKELQKQALKNYLANIFQKLRRVFSVYKPLFCLVDCWPLLIYTLSENGNVIKCIVRCREMKNWKYLLYMPLLLSRTITLVAQ